MSDTREIEQLRREVNELRERLARLEAQSITFAVGRPITAGGASCWGGLPGQTVGVAACVTPV